MTPASVLLTGLVAFVADAAVFVLVLAVLGVFKR